MQRHLGEIAQKSARRFGEQSAYTLCLPNGIHGSLSFNEVDELSNAFAAYLREVLGLKTGDRVAVQMPNALGYPIVAFGIFKAGLVLVNTNPLYTTHEMVHQFRDSGAVAVVLIDLFGDKAKTVQAQCPEVRHWIVPSLCDFLPPAKALLVKFVMKYIKKQIPRTEVAFHTLPQAVAMGRPQVRQTAIEGYTAGVTRETVAALQYTGGTTGVSKGSMLTHGNLLSNVEQVIEFVKSKIDDGKEVILTALPLYHIFAFTVNFLCFHAKGGRNILIPSPRPISNLQKAFEIFPISWMTGVNTLFAAIQAEAWFTPDRYRSLRASVAGGTALHKSVADAWLAKTKTPVIEGYGLTEASPVLTFNPLDGKVKAESIGVTLPYTDIEIRDENGVKQPPGTPGELCARGPQVMKGYWMRPDETAKVLKDGWLLTGDIATVDAEGYYKIVDRKKDMVLVSGFNVFPNEVEDCISRLPQVAEVAVIGVPDEKSGEAVKAFVVVRPGATLDAEQVRSHCKEFMTAYKVPKHVEFRADLPKTPVGKILRKELREK